MAETNIGTASRARLLWHVTANEASVTASLGINGTSTPARTPRPARFACDHG